MILVGWCSQPMKKGLRERQPITALLRSISFEIPADQIQNTFENASKPFSEIV